MKTLLVKDGTQECIDNFSPEHKLLPLTMARTAEAYRLHHLGEINTNPLIAEVSKFDTTYMYSDYLPTYNSGVDELARLTKAIDDSADFSDEDKVYLRLGLSYSGWDEFTEHFPFSLIYGTIDTRSDIYDDLMLGEYDEERILSIQDELNSLVHVWDNLGVNNGSHGTFVHTKRSGSGRNLIGKITLSDRTQKLVHRFSQKVTIDDIAYYTKWANYLTFYGSTIHNGDRVYTRMSKFDTRVHASIITYHDTQGASGTALSVSKVDSSDGYRPITIIL